MKNFLVLVFGILLSQSTLAYQDGTYECKNIEDYPNNIYKIETLQIGTGISAPYLEVTRFYKVKDVIHRSDIRGFALVAKMTIDGEAVETLALGNITLEFSGNNLNNCKKP